MESSNTEPIRALIPVNDITAIIEPLHPLLFLLSPELGLLEDGASDSELISEVETGAGYHRL